MADTPSAHVPMVSFGTWPTPLEPAPRLAVALGLEPDDLWVKRDDLVGLGAGGNKARKLQYTCGAAIAAGATTLITTGAAQSNHARMTAAAGARLGLDVVLLLAGTDDAPRVGNLALDGLFGAQVRWIDAMDEATMTSAAQTCADELAADGVTAAVIPFGGSSVDGTLGYVDCAREIVDQHGDVDHVVVALGSGGTMAGLVHALGPAAVLGVHTGAVDDPHRVVGGLVAGLRERHPTLGVEGQGDLRIRTDQVGAGYSHLTDDVRDALVLAARTESIVLDPVYTGRALAGLRAAVGDGSIRPGERTVFVHTGGMPGLFGHADAMAFAGSFVP